MLLIAAASLARLLVPAGFMPAASGFALIACSGTTPAPAPASHAMPAHGQHHAPGKHEPPAALESPCAFAALSAPTLTGDATGLVTARPPAPEIAPVAPLRRLALAVVRHRPFSHGPPATA